MLRLLFCNMSRTEEINSAGWERWKVLEELVRHCSQPSRHEISGSDETKVSDFFLSMCIFYKESYRGKARLNFNDPYSSFTFEV